MLNHFPSWVWGLSNIDLLCSCYRGDMFGVVYNQLGFMIVRNELTPHDPQSTLRWFLGIWLSPSKSAKRLCSLKSEVKTTNHDYLSTLSDSFHQLSLSL
jgi:hypothetical protein